MANDPESVSISPYWESAYAGENRFGLLDILIDEAGRDKSPAIGRLTGMFNNRREFDPLYRAQRYGPELIRVYIGLWRMKCCARRNTHNMYLFCIDNFEASLLYI